MPVLPQQDVSDSGGKVVKKPVDTSGSKQAKIKSADDIYKVTPENWYKTFPYGFRFNPRDGSGTRTFYLPINPSDMSINTHFATNIVSTLYGVVEEHSEVRFYDININGTTGFVPRYVNAVNEGTGDTDAAGQNLTEDWLGNGRGAFEGAGVSLGGSLPQIANVIAQAKDSFSDAFGGEDNETGVFVDKTGYMAFHNLYRFLLRYKRDTSGEDGFEKRKKHPLTWLNYKDGIKYDCIITSFSMTKNAQNPYMYNYSLSMRCFNMRSIDSKDGDIKDLGKFGLGFGDIGNIPGFGAFGKVVGSAASAINSIAGFF